VTAVIDMDYNGVLPCFSDAACRVCGRTSSFLTYVTTKAAGRVITDGCLSLQVTNMNQPDISFRHFSLGCLLQLNADMSSDRY
jgi:hypothetical protein